MLTDNATQDLYENVSTNIIVDNYVSELQAITESQADSEHDNSVLVIIDVTDDRLMKSTALQQTFMNGRCYNMSLVITCQSYMQIRPCMRSNVDFTMMCNADDESHRKMWEIFGNEPSDIVVGTILQTHSRCQPCAVVYSNHTSPCTKIFEDMMNSVLVTIYRPQKLSARLLVPFVYISDAERDAFT